MEVSVPSANSNKENSSIKTYFKSSKNVRSAIPKPIQSKAAKKKKVRPAPDFSKLHQKWNSKLETGKAASKKPCTVSTGFDLTKPGSHFSREPMREIKVCEEKEEDITSHGPHSAEDQSLPNKNQTQKGVKRRVLGEITSAGLNSPNKSPRTQNKHISHVKLSPNPVIEFQSDDQALSSILNDKGISAPNMYTPGRLTQQTQSARSSLFHQRPSQYSLRDLGTGTWMEGVRERNSIYINYKVHHRDQFQETPEKKLTAAPKYTSTLKAGRILNRHLNASQFQSPAARVLSPISTIKRSQTDNPHRTQKFTWADVLSSPVAEEQVPVARNLEENDLQKEISQNFLTPLRVPNKGSNSNTQDPILADAKFRIPMTFTNKETNKAQNLMTPLRVCSKSVNTIHEEPESESATLDKDTNKVLQQPATVGQNFMTPLRVCKKETGDKPIVITKNLPTPLSNKDTNIEEKSTSVIQSSITPLRVQKIDPSVHHKPTLSENTQDQQMVHVDISLPKSEEDISNSKIQDPRVISCDIANVSGKFIDETEDKMVNNLVPQIKQFVKTTMKQRRQSVDEINQGLSNFKNLQGKLDQLQNQTIVDKLTNLQKLKEQLALAEKSLQRQLKIQAEIDSENIPPNENVRSSQEPQTYLKSTVMDFSESCVNIEKQQDVECNEEMQVDSVMHVENSEKFQETNMSEVFQSPSPPKQSPEEAVKNHLELTPFITKVKELRLTETTDFSCYSKESTEPQNLNLENVETKNLDIASQGSAPKNQSLLTLVGPNSNNSSSNNLQNCNKTLSPINVQSQIKNVDAGEDCLISAPIWTPLALKSKRAITSPQARALVPKVLSHAASMVLDAGRCQSKYESHCCTSPSASCINQSDSRTGRHLGLCSAGGGSSGIRQLMTHPPDCLLTPDKPHAVSSSTDQQHYLDHSLDKAGQDTENNITHFAKDGQTTSTKDKEFDCIPLITFSPVPVSKNPATGFKSTSSTKIVTAGNFHSISPKKATPKSRTAQKSPNNIQTSRTSGRVTSTTRHTSSPTRHVTSEQQHMTPADSQVGSLSLRGNVWQRLRPSPRVHPTPQIHSRLQDSQQLFLETLLDEECALFTCCRPLANGLDTRTRCPNPVAQVLSDGDTMHFLPIADDYHGEMGHLEGSAFGAFTPVHTRSMSRPN